MAASFLFATQSVCSRIGECLVIQFVDFAEILFS